MSNVDHRRDGAAPESAPPAGSKTCPDCAEEVRAAARKCRFCGYTFGETDTGRRNFSTPASLRPQSGQRRTSAGSVAIAAMVLGGLGILSGLRGNSAVLLLGMVAVGLGVWARVQNKRGPAMWGIALAVVAVVGYAGTLLAQSPTQGAVASTSDNICGGYNPADIFDPWCENLRGTLELNQDNSGYGQNFSTLGATCHGIGDYSDISLGVAVVVFDQTGEQLATVPLEGGRVVGEKCEFLFTFQQKLPDAQSYAVEVARRGKVVFTKHELDSRFWLVGLTLG